MASPSPRNAKPSTSKAGAKPTRARKKGGAKRVIGRIFTALLALGLVLGIIASIAVGVAYKRTELPDPDKDFLTNTTFVYYKDGKTKLGSFSVQNRQTLAYKDIPQSMKEAVVAAENRTFWTDRGISPKGIIRSTWTIVRGGEVQGGSTITQQYIKILYLSSERSMKRKFKELLLAIKMNKSTSKEEVLGGYLNTIYFGRGAYGVQAASRAYFNKDAKKLTTPEAAVLSSVLNNPSMYDPSAAKGNKANLLERYRYVLQGLTDMDKITEQQRVKWSKSLPKLPDVPLNSRFGGPKGFLLNMVKQELLNEGFTESEIMGGGLTIVTTFDDKAMDAAVKTAQKYTKEAAKNAGKKTSTLHAAIASVEVGTGEVLAVYGGPDYVSNSRNWATTDRPTASTFKTYAAAAGLQDQFSLRSVLNGNTFTPTGDGVPIRNEFSYQYGPVTLTKATADSINTAFVDLVQKMPDGPKKVIKAATDAGVPKGAGWDPNNRIALGTAEASPLEMANGYATFANNGERAQTHVVKSVKNARGKKLYTAKVATKKAFDEGVARDVTYALSSVVEQGTGRRVQTLGRPVAGKTGTAGVKDDIVSAWFVAYTPQVSTAVMYVAGDGGNNDLDPYARPGDSTFFGGTYPALTWTDYMGVVMQDLPIKQFDPPAYVNKNARDQMPTTRRTTTKATTKTTTKPTQQPTEQPTQEPPTQEATQPKPPEKTAKPDPTTGNGGGKSTP